MRGQFQMKIAREYLGYNNFRTLRRRLTAFNMKQIKDKSNQELLLEEHSSTIVFYIYTMLFTNQIACNLIADLDIYFENEGLFKREIKKDIKLIKSTSLQFEDRMFTVYGNKEDYFVSSFQRLIHEVKPSLDVLFYSIEKEVIDAKHKVSIGRLEQAITLTALACKIRQERVDKLQAISTFFPTLDYLDMNQLLRMLDKLSMKTNRELNRTVDLNISEDCKLALKAVVRKLTNPELIRKAINNE